MAIVSTAVIRGTSAVPLAVEVEIDPAGAGLRAAGLSASHAREIAVRLRAAFASSGFDSSFLRKVVVSFSDEDLARLGGAALDLPIALAALAAEGTVPSYALDGAWSCGELALDGALRRVAGALPFATLARSSHARAVILPSDCASEAVLADPDEVTNLAASSLAEAVAHLRRETPLQPPRLRHPAGAHSPPAPDFSEVADLYAAKRALEVAAAGGHNLLLIGPPGSGKSLLARCLPGILPEPSPNEALEVASIYSAAGRLGGMSGVPGRPFRAPHHDVSVAGLIGGGPILRPGEATLAHGGVLFLDELPEFRRAALDALREPLRLGEVTISRSRGSFSMPARFTLVGAMTPCACGYRGSPMRSCTCSDESVRRWLSRTEAFADENFPIAVGVPHVDYRSLARPRAAESSADVRERVRRARDRQVMRQGALNARLAMSDIQVNDGALKHEEAVVRRFNLKPEIALLIRRVARTTADLAGREVVSAADVAEAAALFNLNERAVS